MATIYFAIKDTIAQKALLFINENENAQLFDYFLYIFLSNVVIVFAILKIMNRLTSKHKSKAGSLKNRIFKFFSVFPIVSTILNSEHKKAAESARKFLQDHKLIKEINSKIPDDPTSEQKINEIISEVLQKENNNLRTNKISGGIYINNDKLETMILDKSSEYIYSNFKCVQQVPGAYQIQSEVLSMIKDMFGYPDCCGMTTTGGTESILMAMLAHREYYCKLKNIDAPEMVVSENAHAAFYKAASYFNITLKKIPSEPFKTIVSWEKYEKEITKNTIVIVGSMVSFPHMSADDIEKLSDLAVKYKIGLHVDCCLGSFLLPFAREKGLINNFGFELPGVTSMSIDPHKYGYAPKGLSVVLYKNEELRSAQMYVNPNHVGGVYTTQIISGGRSPASIIGGWIALTYYGKEGYRNLANKIFDTVSKIKSSLENHKVLKIVDKNSFLGVSICSIDPKINIYSVYDILTAKGWSLGAVLRPSAIHIHVTQANLVKYETMLADLNEAVKEIQNNPQKYKTSKTGKLYGSAATFENTFILDSVIKTFITELSNLEVKQIKIL